ncbi:hypothetical protein ACFLZM_00515 [Thermodesulfobacteriota bacterium]
MKKQHESDSNVHSQTMIEKLTRENPWVWIVVQDADGDSQFMGLQDQETDIGFIPIFLTKEEALDCYMQMPRKKGHRYEVQAIQYNDLARQTADTGFMLFMLDGEGKVREKLVPHH